MRTIPDSAIQLDSTDTATISGWQIAVLDCLDPTLLAKLETLVNISNIDCFELELLGLASSRARTIYDC